MLDNVPAAIAGAIGLAAFVVCAGLTLWLRRSPDDFERPHRGWAFAALLFAVGLLALAISAAASGAVAIAAGIGISLVPVIVVTVIAWREAGARDHTEGS